MTGTIMNKNNRATDQKIEVACSVRVDGDKRVGMHLHLNSEAAVNEFRTLMARGLNTWDTAPEWMFSVATDLGD